jgi:hypothetical protein
VTEASLCQAAARAEIEKVQPSKEGDLLEGFVLQLAAVAEVEMIQTPQI